MGQVDANGDEWFDLRDPQQAAEFDAQTAGMRPQPLSYYREQRDARKTVRNQNVAKWAATHAIETAAQ